MENPTRLLHLVKYFSNNDLENVDISLHFNLNTENLDRLKALTPKEDELIYQDDLYDFQKWNPLTYPLVKNCDIQDPQSLSLYANIVRVSYSVNVDKEGWIETPRFGEFLEGLVIRGNKPICADGRSRWPTLKLLFNEVPIKIEPMDNGYYFFGMIPLCMAPFTNIEIVFDDCRMIDTVELIYHSTTNENLDPKFRRDFETAQFFNTKFILSIQEGHITPYELPISINRIHKAINIRREPLPYQYENLGIYFIDFDDRTTHTAGIGDLKMYKMLVGKYLKQEQQSR
ncbi:MAG TPA: hypothetical protein PKD85_05095 [Saprospiraceae bacterium]|nr:hypothetical protein [Saprospiraceae bacterium]